MRLHALTAMSACEEWRLAGGHMPCTVRNVAHSEITDGARPLTTHSHLGIWTSAGSVSSGRGVECGMSVKPIESLTERGVILLGCIVWHPGRGLSWRPEDEVAPYPLRLGYIRLVYHESSM